MKVINGAECQNLSFSFCSFFPPSAVRSRPLASRVEMHPSASTVAMVTLSSSRALSFSLSLSEPSTRLTFVDHLSDSCVTSSDLSPLFSFPSLLSLPFLLILLFFLPSLSWLEAYKTRSLLSESYFSLLHFTLALRSFMSFLRIERKEQRKEQRKERIKVHLYLMVSLDFPFSCML